MDERRCLLVEQAYKRYLGAFIQKALNKTGNLELSRDVVQDCFYNLLKHDITVKSEGHARALIYMQIDWMICHYYDTKKNSYFTTDSYFDFENNDDLLFETEKLSSAFDYYPTRDRVRNHIKNLTPRLKEVILLKMQGFKDFEIQEMTGNNGKNRQYITSCKREAYKMIRNFRVAGSLRSPLERSQLRTKDDKTDKIMEMTASGFTDRQMSEILGLSRTQIRSRRSIRRKLLRKLEEN